MVSMVCDWYHDGGLRLPEYLNGLPEPTAHGSANMLAVLIP